MEVHQRPLKTCCPPPGGIVGNPDFQFLESLRLSQLHRAASSGLCLFKGGLHAWLFQVGTWTLSSLDHCRAMLVATSTLELLWVSLTLSGLHHSSVSASAWFPDFFLPWSHWSKGHSLVNTELCLRMCSRPAGNTAWTWADSSVFCFLYCKMAAITQTFLDSCWPWCWFSELACLESPSSSRAGTYPSINGRQEQPRWCILLSLNDFYRN